MYIYIEMYIYIDRYVDITNFIILFISNIFYLYVLTCRNQSLAHLPRFAPVAWEAPDFDVEDESGKQSLKARSSSRYEHLMAW